MPRLLNVLVAVVSLIWGALTIYTEIIEADPDAYSIRSPEVRQQLENCTGTFAQRQACAERITEERQQLGFLVWCGKVAIILGPPLVLWGLTGLASRQRRGEPEPAPRRPAPGPALRPRPRPRPRDTLAPETSAERPREPMAPTHTPEGPAEQAPLFTGGRREPVRRRDR